MKPTISIFKGSVRGSKLLEHKDQKIRIINMGSQGFMMGKSKIYEHKDETIHLVFSNGSNRTILHI